VRIKAMKAITLIGLLDLLRPTDRVIVLRRMGPHECEVAAVGAARALRVGRYAELSGASAVEKISLDTDGWTAIGEHLPVLVVTVSEDGSDAAVRRSQRGTKEGLKI